MKKIIISLLSILIIVWVWFFHVSAFDAVRVNPETFILDAQNDLWKIQVMWKYFVPTPWYEYDNVEWIKSQMLKWLDYDNEFYKTRHITADVVNGTDSYKVIEWNKPLVVKSLSTMKSKLKWFLFAYRKPTGIFWMDWADFTEAFFSWYGSETNQIVIIYPIKEKAWKEKGKLLWFMEYPCWNLVCRDSMCTDLIPKPVCWDWILNKDVGEVCDPKDPNTKKGCTKTCQWEQLSCEVKVPTTKFDQTRDVSWLSIKKDSALVLQAVVANGKVFKGETINNFKNLWKLNPWTYTVTAVWTNPYSKEIVQCTPATLTVDNKIWCWDGIKNWLEECDYKANWVWKSCKSSCKINHYCGDWIKDEKEQCDYAIPGMENYCSKSCSLNKVTCNATINPNKFIQWQSLKQDYFKVTTGGTLIDTWYFNTEKLALNSIYNKSLDYCGMQKVTFFVKNPYNTSEKYAQCSVQFNVFKREYCGDGVIQTATEQCDPKDGKTWIACSNECKLKYPTCNITDVLSEYTVGDTINFWVTASTYSKIVSVISNGVKWSASGNVWNIRFNQEWTYELTVSVWNIFDTKNTITSSCKTNVKVIPKRVCETVPTK